jgi:hypothetical protein
MDIQRTNAIDSFFIHEFFEGANIFKIADQKRASTRLFNCPLAGWSFIYETDQELLLVALGNANF